MYNTSPPHPPPPPSLSSLSASLSLSPSLSLSLMNEVVHTSPTIGSNVEEVSE